MLTDKNTTFFNNENVRDADPKYHAAARTIDLRQSPDLGVGRQFVVMVKIHTYDEAVSGTAGTDIQLVVGDDNADLSLATTLTVIASTGTISVANLNALADTGTVGLDDVAGPVILRLDPEMIAALDVDQEGTGITARRYLGARLVHATAAPTTMTASVQLVECFGARVGHSHFKSGLTIE